MNAAQLFISCLENEGVEYIFGIPGEENLHVMGALRESSIKFITAAVMTQNIDTTMYVYKHLAASAIMVIDHSAFRVDWMPFSGLRQSGYGVGGIPYIYRDMQIEKMLVIPLQGTLKLRWSTLRQSLFCRLDEIFEPSEKTKSDVCQSCRVSFFNAMQ